MPSQSMPSAPGARGHQAAQLDRLVAQLRGIDAHAVADQARRRLQLPIRLGVVGIAAPVEADRRPDDSVVEVEAEGLAGLESATEHQAVPARRKADVLDDVLVLIRPE